MKIGILTYHSVYNFGANLQVHSTVSYLKNHNYQPIVINWIPEELEKGYDRTNPSEQAAAHKEFINSNLPLTELCRSDEDIVKVINDHSIEAVIIGSDAVLQHHTLLSRMRLTKRGVMIKEKRSNTIFPNPFWGSFIPLLDKEIPVMVMSASSQNTRYKQIFGRRRKEIGNALVRFKIITVRDGWTKQMVRYLTRGAVDPPVTPDPVFAYNQNVTSQIEKQVVMSKFGLPEKYILLSFKNQGVVSEPWLEKFDIEAQKKGYSAVLLTMPGGIIFTESPLKKISPPLNPAEWYALIKYASGYVGENMHPVVVSLHNKVPFFSYDNYGIIKGKYFVNEKSSKIYDLLSRAGFLEHRTSAVGRNIKNIPPAEILEKLSDFDKDKCSVFHDKQLEEYNVMMENILSFI